jgi:uncharacterized protein (DUF488 family)
VRIYTIGHSTRSADDFIALLEAHSVTGLADVRTVPKSRRHPHFAREALEKTLPLHGIEYRHFADLGGLRKPRRDSPNGAWRVEGFRGYADHMQTPAFQAAIDDLLTFAGRRQVAVMCAEAKWWQCHRQLVADALVARGIEVRHIMTAREAPAHELTSFARVEAGHVLYPALV